jgi:hypothetical protein
MKRRSDVWILETLKAIREGRHPTPSSFRKIALELARRTPKGYLTVWKERPWLKS